MFFELVAAREGHFQLESGHHGTLWLDLDALFATPRRIAPLVEALAVALRPHDVQVVCGPLLGGAFLAQLVATALAADFCFTERHLTPGESGLYPARYRLPQALRGRVRHRRVAIVDDVMSAGSAVRGTYDELEAHAAQTVAVGTLLGLGTLGSAAFTSRGVAVESVVRRPYQLWTPAECPLCRAGTPYQTVSKPAETG